MMQMRGIQLGTHITDSDELSLNLKSASKFGTGPIWGSVLAVFGVVLEFFNLASH